MLSLYREYILKNKTKTNHHQNFSTALKVSEERNKCVVKGGERNVVWCDHLHPVRNKMCVAQYKAKAAPEHYGMKTWTNEP